jgi:hypothetical protein
MSGDQEMDNLTDASVGELWACEETGAVVRLTRRESASAWWTVQVAGPPVDHLCIDDVATLDTRAQKWRRIWRAR